MIKIIAVGKIKDKALSDLIFDYQKKIAHFSKLEIIEVNDYPEGKDIGISISKEATEIFKHIKREDFVVLLDLKGKMLDSISLAKQVDNWQTTNVSLVIGGSNGVSKEIQKRADYLLKLSDLTFPHQLTRLIILEQIYRSFKIINKQKYHK